MTKRTRHPPRTCPVDGTSFGPTHGGRHYCSDRCRNRAAYYRAKSNKGDNPSVSAALVPFGDDEKSTKVGRDQNDDFTKQTASKTRRNPRPKMPQMFGGAISALVPFSTCGHPVEGWKKMQLEYHLEGDVKYYHVWAPKDSDMWALGNAVAKHMGITSTEHDAFELIN